MFQSLCQADKKTGTPPKNIPTVICKKTAIQNKLANLEKLSFNVHFDNKKTTGYSNNKNHTVCVQLDSLPCNDICGHNISGNIPPSAINTNCLLLINLFLFVFIFIKSTVAMATTGRHT